MGNHEALVRKDLTLDKHPAKLADPPDGEAEDHKDEYHANWHQHLVRIAVRFVEDEEELGERKHEQTEVENDIDEFSALFALQLDLRALVAERELEDHGDAQVWHRKDPMLAPVQEISNAKRRPTQLAHLAEPAFYE